MSYDLLRSIKDIEQIEKIPIEDRIIANNTYDLFKISAEKYSDRTALTFLPQGTFDCAPQTYSFRNFFENVTRTANLFNHIEKGSCKTVSLLMPNLPETHFCLWGAEAAGIANPINPALNIEEVAAIMKAADASILVAPGPAVDAVLWQKAQRLAALMGRKLKLVAVNGGGGSVLPEGVFSYDRSVNDFDGRALVSGRRFKQDDIASYFHTGGTTGTPKLAQHTHFNEVANAWMASFSFGFDERDIMLTGLPLFHVYGAIISGITAFSSGMQVVLAGKDGFRNKKTVSDFWRLVEKYNVTNFSAVPTIYAALMDVPLANADISSMRFGVCGAAPLPTSVFLKFEERTGVKIIEGFGMTESTAFAACNPRDGERRIGSIGFRAAYQQIRIVCVDEKGKYYRDADTDEMGILSLSGPNVIPGYKQKEANRNLWVEPGWLNTGDLARIDHEGYVWLTGRVKDLIIRGGHNIDPQMIENALCSHSMVEIAAAVGKPDAYAGEIPIAYVVLKPQSKTSTKELLEFAREHIPERGAAPQEIIILDEMPVTTVGKIFKPALRIDATRRVVAEQLNAYAIGAEFDIFIDKKIGMVVKIELHEGQKPRHAELKNVLGAFTFTTVFHLSDDKC